uniref:Uncharacterized protein n=1 Tax=Bionectria ochroleuca TaxID=29856 RepID=A0A8H7NKH8_BIOOC
MPTAGPSLEYLGLKSPVRCQVFVYSIEVVLDVNGIRLHHCLKPAVEARRRVSPSSLSVSSSSSVEICASLKEGFFMALSCIEHQFPDGMVVRRCPGGMMYGWHIPVLSVVPEGNISTKKEKDKQYPNTFQNE